jgi:hypothetical protein
MGAQEFVDFAAGAMVFGVLLVVATIMLRAMGVKSQNLVRQVLLAAVGLIGVGVVIGAATMLSWVGDGNNVSELFTIGKR